MRGPSPTTPGPVQNRRSPTPLQRQRGDCSARRRSSRPSCTRSATCNSHADPAAPEADWIRATSDSRDVAVADPDPPADQSIRYAYDRRGIQTQWITEGYDAGDQGGRKIQRFLNPSGTLQQRRGTMHVKDSDPRAQGALVPVLITSSNRSSLGAATPSMKKGRQRNQRGSIRCFKIRSDDEGRDSRAELLHHGQILRRGVNDLIGQ